MKLYENTMYYCVKVRGIYSSQVDVYAIKIIKHQGECNTMPIQRIIYEYNNKQYNTVLNFNFDGKILKQQNNHLFKITSAQALCLTIADCKHFIRQYYRNEVATSWYWWIPRRWGMVSKTLLHNALKEFNAIIKQMEIKQEECIQQ